MDIGHHIGTKLLAAEFRYETDATEENSADGYLKMTENEQTDR